MVTPFREYPLLNTPNMILVLLRGAVASPTATVSGCADSLSALLAQAHEQPPFGRREIEDRLGALVRALAAAKLVVAGPDGGFSATERGREALERHPQGLDLADLVAYPEFARHMRGLELHRAALDPRSAGYDQGFYAYWTGRGPADNPFPGDSADHLAWENGWSEALDEDYRWNGPHAAENLR
jgi:hypothetical protein